MSFPILEIAISNFMTLHMYEGHSLCFLIWFFNNTYNHSVYSSFSKKLPSACTRLTILSNQLSMTPDHFDWGMSKMTPSGIFDVLKLLSFQLPFDGIEQKPVTGGKVRWIWWSDDQLKIIGGYEVCSYSCSVHAGIVMMEQ